MFQKMISSLMNGMEDRKRKRKENDEIKYNGQNHIRIICLQVYVQSSMSRLNSGDNLLRSHEKCK
jgi:hypothetical protein